MSENQAKNEYSEELVLALERSLSSHRLNSYIVQAKGNKVSAIRLHERNTELSEALFGVIQGLEITLRNSIHRTLEKYIGFADWYDHIGLEDSEKDALYLAKEGVQSRHKSLTPPRIIAQLNLGFWVRLTAGDYEKALWVPYLYKVFPIKTNRRQLNLRLNKIKDLRNQIAHHERIINRDLDADYAEILETLGWLCSKTLNWVKATNRFTKFLKASASVSALSFPGGAAPPSGS